jgi:hypothetical protein
MTLRTSLLAVCMVAVPGIALFSHRVPPDVRAGTREAVSKAVAWCRDAVLPDRAVPVTRPDQTAGGAASQAVPEAMPPRTVQRDRPEVALARLGATSLECRQLPEPQGGHLASCAVPLDAHGQLLRVFHGSGGDRDAALAALVVEVDGWRSRFAGTGRPEHPGSSAVDP